MQQVHTDVSVQTCGSSIALAILPDANDTSWNKCRTLPP